MRISFILTTLALMFVYQSVFAEIYQKNRVIVLTDIEADPDDSQSMVRYNKLFLNITKP